MKGPAQNLRKMGAKRFHHTGFGLQAWMTFSVEISLEGTYQIFDYLNLKIQIGVSVMAKLSMLSKSVLGCAVFLRRPGGVHTLEREIGLTLQIPTPPIEVHPGFDSPLRPNSSEGQ